MSRVSTAVCATLSTKIIPCSVAAVGSVPMDELEKWPYQAAQYGCQDLLAYSSYSDNSGDVFVVDMNSMQLVQTLHGHRSPVTCVQWKSPPASYLQHGLFLLTGDREGSLAIWDVAEGVVLNSLNVPNRQCIRILSLLTSQHLLVLTGDGTSFVYDSHLADAEPFRDINLPFRSHQGESITPLHMCSSKLSSCQTSCVVLGDRIRVIGSLDLVAKRNGCPWAKDLIYDSENGYETVLDAIFSEAEEEVLYFATRNSVGAYDWKTSLLLNEQVLWHTKGDVEFRRLFSSFPSTLSECTLQLPLLYSFSTDQRLYAWYVPRTDKVTSVSIDVRGARIASKTVANVVQSKVEANMFAVIFADGSIARWRFSLESRRWSLEGYLSFALLRPTALCVVGDDTVSFALENGHLVLIDVMHNVTLRRVNIVHSGGTRITHLCPHRWGESVWVVTNKNTQNRHRHQVTLFDCRSGVVIRILRRPSHADSTRMKEITLSSDGIFLLLEFQNGTFEVWNVEESTLIYFYEGMGVAGVAWAPRSFLACLTGVRGVPQLLTIIFTDGAMSCWTVYKDRLIQNRDTASLLSSTGAVRVICAPAGEVEILIDGTGIPTVVSNRMCGFQASRLKNLPSHSSAVSLAASAEVIHPGATETLSWEPLVAFVFEDGSFGVWSVSSQDRLGYSKTSHLNLSARSLAWIKDTLVILTTSGDIAIVDKLLASINSSVSSKALRRPMQSSAFFLPAHRTYIQTTLEMQKTEDTCESTSSSMASYLVQSIEASRRPCRGPFGQIITQDILTLTQELNLYKETMIPEHILHALRSATSLRQRDEAAFWVARLFGQRDKQRFWAQFCMCRHFWHAGIDSSATPSGDVNPTRNAQPSSTERTKSSRELEAPLCYLLADRFSEAVEPSEVVQKNRMWFNELRMVALESTKVQNIDDSKSRLSVARDLLRISEPQKAIDVLMDGNYESEQFAHLANLAVTIAASTAAHESPSSALFALTTKRAAAMLLAKGDVDGAVEKFLMSGDIYEAALALQSCGRWSEAATVSKVSSTGLHHRKEILHRWCSHCAKRGELLEAARVLISLASVGEALVLLSESAHLTDTAGLLVTLLLEDYGFAMRDEFQLPTPSPSKDEDASDALKLSEVVMNILSDYCSVLNSVGNVTGERAVLELIASLKRGIRTSPTSVTR